MKTCPVARVTLSGEGRIGLGAVYGWGDEVEINDDVLSVLGLVDEEIRIAFQQAKSRLADVRACTDGPESLARSVAGREVLVVDDSIATGGTMRAALQLLRAFGPHRVVVAAPVGSAYGLERLGDLADELVVLHTPAGGAFDGATHFAA